MLRASAYTPPNSHKIAGYCVNTCVIGGQLHAGVLAQRRSKSGTNPDGRRAKRGDLSGDRKNIVSYCAAVTTRTSPRTVSEPASVPAGSSMAA
jgi:hypothetical protein